MLAQTAFVVLLLTGSVPARAENVALTFDDLPMFGEWTSTTDATNMTRAMLAALVREHIPATGFVTGNELEGRDRPMRIALLRMWSSAGMGLGIHSYSHLSLTKTPVNAYIADVAKADAVTRNLFVGQRWFRHPFLETGPTKLIRTRVDSWLAAHGYLMAPVTLENSDWMFSAVYDDAVSRGDLAGARKTQTAYLKYTVKIVCWYRKAALQLLGRRPDLIFLLHASHLNAVSVTDIATILKGQGLHPVSLGHAMRILPTK